jgi:hypothetical protein
VEALENSGQKGKVVLDFAAGQVGGIGGCIVELLRAADLPYER